MPEYNTVCSGLLRGMDQKSRQPTNWKHCFSRGWGRDGEGADLVLVHFSSVLPWSGNWDRAESAGR